MTEFQEAVSALTTADTFAVGTNSRTAKRIDPVGTRKLIMKGLNDMLRFIDANKTIENEGDMLFTIDALLDDFPAMNVEEFLIVFNRMKKGYYGKYYERLKLPEISECCRKYESEDRVLYLEKRNQDLKQLNAANQSDPISDEEMYNSYRAYAAEKDKRDKEKGKYSEGFQKFRAEYLMNQKLQDQPKTEENENTQS